MDDYRSHGVRVLYVSASYLINKIWLRKELYDYKFSGF